jgi:methylmalonyl-CoA mutase
MALDRASKLGLDADYAKTEDVGNGGLSISGLSSFSRALKDIDITKYPLFISTGFSSVPFVSILSAYCKKNDIDISKITGSVEADPIGYWALEGELPVPVNSAITGLKSSMIWKQKNAPLMKTISVSTLPYSNNGANATQELAFAIATASEYIKSLLNLGLNIDDIAQNIKVTFGIGSSFFTEISKFRAAKLLWKNLISAFGGNEESQSINISAVTTQLNKTIFDPHVNILRTTTEAFSAIAGGINSLQISPYDSLFSVPDNFSRRIARNVQIVLKEEAHFGNTIDAAGGSYFVEKLTEELAQNAWKLFQQIEKNGGMIESLKNNFIQDEIDKVYQQRAKDVAKRKSVIVGTNMYANSTEEMIVGKKVNHKELQKQRSEFLQKFRVPENRKGNEDVLEALAKLSQKCDDESINVAANAILNGATLGEITHSCRVNVNDIERTKINAVKIRRLSEPFEELRIKSNSIKTTTGKKPSVFLATMGTIKEYKGRADFSRGFFEVGGFEVNNSNGFDSSDKVIEALKESNSSIVVICSTDDKYIEVVPELASKLKAYKKDITIVLAGYPKDKIEEYKNSGIDEFIYLGADAYGILKKLIMNYE